MIVTAIRLHQINEVISVKGYQPNLQCKKQFETSSKTGQNNMELGMKQDSLQCDCEKGKCQYNEYNKK